MSLAVESGRARARAVKDLPVPTWLFYWGGAVVLVVSFVLLVFLWRQPLLARHAGAAPAPAGLSAVLLSTPLRVVVQTVSVLLFALVFATALLGDERPVQELRADVDLRHVLARPAAALGAARRRVARAQPVARDRRRLRLGAPAPGRKPAKVAPYPERLGRWPAAVALFAFVSLELAYKDPSAPLTLAWAIAVYTVVTLFGYATYGRETWHTRGEGFAVAFGYLARMAPLTVVEGRLRFRWPFTGWPAASRCRARSP